MIYRTPRTYIDDYYARVAYSQSEIKLFIKGADYYLNTQIDPELEKYYDDAEHYKIGSAVDCIITEGKEVFEKLYFESTLDKLPSDNIVSVLHMVYDHAREEAAEAGESMNEELIAHRDKILKACEYHSYIQRYGDDAKTKAIVTEGEAYWLALIEAKGRRLLSVKEMEIVNRAVDKLTNHPTFMNIMDEASSSNEIDVFFQIPIYFMTVTSTSRTHVSCKALIDILIIDHRTHNISIWDIKTLWDTVQNFDTEARKRRYDIQGSWYTEAVQHAIRASSDFLNHIFTMYEYSIRGLANYSVNSFYFLVQSTTFDSNSVLFEATENFMVMGKKGRSESEVLAVEKSDDNSDGFSSKVTGIRFHKIVGWEEALNNLYKIKKLIEIGRLKERGPHPDNQILDW